MDSFLSRKGSLYEAQNSEYKRFAFWFTGNLIFFSQEMNNRMPQSVLYPSQIDYLIFRSSQQNSVFLIPHTHYLLGNWLNEEK